MLKCALLDSCTVSAKHYGASCPATLFFPSRTSVMAAVISLPRVKKIAPLESLGIYTNLPGHSNLSFTSKRSLLLQPHQHKKAEAVELTFNPTDAPLKCQICVSVWESDLFEALIRLVTLLIWYSAEQNITLTAKHSSLTSGQRECPNNDEWDLFALPASKWSAIFRSSSLPDMETGMKSFKAATCQIVILALPFSVLQLHRCLRCTSDECKPNTLFLCCNVWEGKSVWRKNKTLISSTNRNIWRHCCCALETTQCNPVSQNHYKNWRVCLQFSALISLGQGVQDWTYCRGAPPLLLGP